MFYILISLLVLVNLAPVFIPGLDFWHAQGFVAQIGIALMFTWSFFEIPKQIKQKNIPLGLLHLWIALFTAFFCVKAQIIGKYDTMHFFPYFNFLCIIIFYKLVVGHIYRWQIELILKVLRCTVIFILILCVLQYFRLGQIFVLLAPDNPNFNNPVVGLIGNPTHLSGFLATTIPLFLFRGNRQDWLCITLLLLILCFAGTTPGDPAISGFIIAVAMFFYFYKREVLKCASVAIVLIIAFLLLKDGLSETFLGLSGRDTIWAAYVPLFQKAPITGYGLGAINMIYKTTSVPLARHLHMEFFHYAFELGLIGAVLILNLVHKFIFTIAENRTELTLKTMVIGFLVSCCFNYPSHLWVPSVWAMFAYAAYYSLKNERLIWPVEKR